MNVHVQCVIQLMCLFVSRGRKPTVRLCHAPVPALRTVRALLAPPDLLYELILIIIIIIIIIISDISH